MLSVWNWIYNTCIRDLSVVTRSIISIILFCLAVGCFIMAVKRKSDVKPLGIAWIVLCIIFLLLSSVYIFVP